MSDKKRIIGCWVVSSVFLVLLGFETYALYWVCNGRGFMTVQEFCLAATLLSVLHMVFVLPFAKMLPVRVWQVPVLTVALLQLGWHNTNAGRLNYWTTMDRLHNGMTVAQVKETVSPHLLTHGRYIDAAPTPKEVAQSKQPAAYDFTGTLVCLPLHPSGNDADEDGAVITFERGYVTNVFTREGD